jgi:hypothetical protein
MQSGEPSLLALAEDLVELEGRVRNLHAAIGAARSHLFPGSVMPMPSGAPPVEIKVAPAPVAPPLPPGLLRPGAVMLKPPEAPVAPTGHVSPDEAA